MTKLLDKIRLYYAKILKKARGRSVNNSHIDDRSNVSSGCNVYDSKIDRYTYCGYDCHIVNTEIGPFCSISNNVILGGASHPLDFVSTSSAFLAQKDTLKAKLAHHEYSHRPPIVIGPDVWIGTNAIIRSGVTVGAGAVIGMGSIVVKDVAPYEIVAGNPASVRRMRFSPDIIAAFMQLRWWDLSDDELRANGDVFNNPIALLKRKGFL